MALQAKDGGNGCATYDGDTKSQACYLKACGPPRPSRFTCVATGAALVAKLKATCISHGFYKGACDKWKGANIALICTAAKRCVISGVRLQVGKNVEVKLVNVDSKDNKVSRRCCPMLRARLCFLAADASTTGPERCA